jgi:hypothetical protein
MDALLVQRAMFKASGADIHAVANLVHEYGMVSQIAKGDVAEVQERRGDPDWGQSMEQIERCLRLYVRGTPIRLAKRLSGYFPGRQAG